MSSFLLTSIVTVKPKSLKDCIILLQQQANLHSPATQQEWLDVQRSCIDVRRAHILSDTLREMQKPRI